MEVKATSELVEIDFQARASASSLPIILRGGECRQECQWSFRDIVCTAAILDNTGPRGVSQTKEVSTDRTD
jgi:hypothetical protein